MSTALINPIGSVGTRSIAATGYNFAVCERCGHDLRDQLPEIGAQIWACVECGSMRQWGIGRPPDRGMKAALQCDGCQAVTRHRFVGAVGHGAWWR
jgi:hypothetical protein